MIRRLYEALTGTPWTTTRSMSAEFGPLPATRYADELAAFTDAELVERGPEILAQLRELQALVEQMRDQTGDIFEVGYRCGQSDARNRKEIIR